MKKVKVDKQLLKSLITLSSVIEARDSYTGGHIWRVSQYSRELASKIGMNHNEMAIVELGGLVHDLGKIGIPDSILNKKDKLTDSEFLIMKEHAKIGLNLIENHPLSPLVMDAIYNHHERIDGNGYPEKINDNELSLIPKIICITDAFDAMTSTRPYRKGMPINKALNIIEEEKGKQFDSKLASYFIDMVNNDQLNNILSHCGYEKPLLTCPGCGPIIAYNHADKDGDIISCPCCRGNFTIHGNKDTFEIEYNHSRNEAFVPQSDNDTIDIFTKSMPNLVKI